VNQDFHDLLSALCAAGARFLIVGAYAVSFHAEPPLIRNKIALGRPKDLLDVDLLRRRS
jgi:hypothetical protein